MDDASIKFKTRKRGLTPSEMVESNLTLWAAGGERAEDFDHFMQDKALAELTGHELLAAQTARDFLSQFHEDNLPSWSGGKASVPSESAALQGLVAANNELILASRNAASRKPQKISTRRSSTRRRRPPRVPTTVSAVISRCLCCGLIGM